MKLQPKDIVSPGTFRVTEVHPAVTQLERLLDAIDASDLDPVEHAELIDAYDAACQFMADAEGVTS